MFSRISCFRDLQGVPACRSRLALYHSLLNRDIRALLGLQRSILGFGSKRSKRVSRRDQESNFGALNGVGSLEFRMSDDQQGVIYNLARPRGLENEVFEKTRVSRNELRTFENNWKGIGKCCRSIQKESIGKCWINVGKGTREYWKTSDKCWKMLDKMSPIW